MSIGSTPETRGELAVPTSLQPGSELGRQLPALDLATLDQLRHNGWHNIGIMVAIVDPDGRVMMQHHARREKNGHGVLGPLGETTKSMGSAIEQPAETLYRGFKEETGIMSPQELGITLHAQDGWRINQWPNSDTYRHRFSCAIAFPAFLPPEGYEYLLDQFVPNEETYQLEFLEPGEILDMDPEKLRRGVQPWLKQLVEADLLTVDGLTQLAPVDLQPAPTQPIASQDVTFNE